MKLGVLKMVADKIPALLYAVCGQGHARRGPKDETLVAANERIAHMGRLILATLAPPGYVRPPSPVPSACACVARDASVAETCVFSWWTGPVCWVRPASEVALRRHCVPRGVHIVIRAAADRTAPSLLDDRYLPSRASEIRVHH